MVTLHVPGPGAVTVAVPSGDLTSNLWSPVSSQRVFVIGTEGSSGVDVDVKITDVPVTTGFGAQSKSAVGFPSATPTPNGDMTAASVSKQAASRGLTRLMRILKKKPGSPPSLRFGVYARRSATSRGPQAREVPQRPAELALHRQAGTHGALSQRAVRDHVRIAEQLAHHDPAARLYHAAQLPQGGLLVGDLAQHRDEVGGVEGAVGVGHLAGVGPLADDGGDPVLGGSSQRVVQHLLLNVEHVEAPARSHPLRDRQRVVARAR